MPESAFPRILGPLNFDFRGDENFVKYQYGGQKNFQSTYYPCSVGGFCYADGLKRCICKPSLG